MTAAGTVQPPQFCHADQEKLRVTVDGAAINASGPAPVSAAPVPDAESQAHTPNELGRIPVLEYHLIVPEEKGEFTRTPERLRKDLEELKNESPNDPKFDFRSVNRQIMYKNALAGVLNQLDKLGPGGRYVSDGDPKSVARP